MTKTSILLAGDAIPTGPFAAGGRFRLFRQILARLQALHSLNRLSVRHLRDIGLTPADVTAIRGLPLTIDVSTRLAIAAGARAGNW